MGVQAAPVGYRTFHFSMVRARPFCVSRGGEIIGAPGFFNVYRLGVVQHRLIVIIESDDLGSDDLRLARRSGGGFSSELLLSVVEPLEEPRRRGTKIGISLREMMLLLTRLFYP
jgi:hypothetical protein